MSTPAYFYKDPSGREIGPLPLAALAQLRLANTLSDDTLVRPSDSEEWKPCRDVIALPGSAPGAGEAPQPNPKQASVLWSRFSWSLFVVVMLCFLLPFMAVSCQGKKVAEFTGLESRARKECEEPGFAPWVGFRLQKGCPEPGTCFGGTDTASGTRPAGHCRLGPCTRRLPARARPQTRVTSAQWPCGNGGSRMSPPAQNQH